MTEKILIIDAYNAFLRSYAIDPSINSNGELIGGYKGFLKQIQKYLREIEPDEIYVIWDGTGGSARRRSANSSYKEGRKPVNFNRVVDIELSPEETIKNKMWQVKELVNHLNYAPIKQLMLDDVEADDVIAHICNMEEMQDKLKVIVSNDKDFYQLLNKRTVVWRPATDKIMTTKDVLEEYAIHPVNMTVARSIIGDSSDNLPGVKGMGFKTVNKFFPELSSSSRVSLEDLFVKSRNIEGTYKAIELLKESETNVRTNYRIMQLYHPVIPEEHMDTIKEVVEKKAKYSKIFFDSLLNKNELHDINWDSMKSYFLHMNKE